MKKLNFILPFILIFSSCKKENKKVIPLYHIDGINYKIDKKSYHLLYNLEKDVFLNLINKEASFYLAIYSESCSSSCSMFDISLYTLANTNSIFIPYMNKTVYDTISNTNCPTLKENAILFYNNGSLYSYIDITEDNVDSTSVKNIIESKTYDSNLNIVTPFIKNIDDKIVNCFTFTKENKDDSNIIYPNYSTHDKTLYLDCNRTDDYSVIQSNANPEYKNIYLYFGLDYLTDNFYSKTNIKKEDLINSSSYII